MPFALSSITICHWHHVYCRFSELPQELRETQERLDLLKSDVETKSNLDTESRLKEADASKKQFRQISHRIEELGQAAIGDRTRFESLSRDLIAAQGTLAQVNFNILLNCCASEALKTAVRNQDACTCWAAFVYL